MNNRKKSSKVSPVSALTKLGERCIIRKPNPMKFSYVESDDESKKNDENPSTSSRNFKKKKTLIMSQDPEPFQYADWIQKEMMADLTPGPKGCSIKVEVTDSEFFGNSGRLQPEAGNAGNSLVVSPSPTESVLLEDRKEFSAKVMALPLDPRLRIPRSLKHDARKEKPLDLCANEASQGSSVYGTPDNQPFSQNRHLLPVATSPLSQEYYSAQSQLSATPVRSPTLSDRSVSHNTLPSPSNVIDLEAETDSLDSSASNYQSPPVVMKRSPRMSEDINNSYLDVPFAWPFQHLWTTLSVPVEGETFSNVIDRSAKNPRVDRSTSLLKKPEETRESAGMPLEEAPTGLQKKKRRKRAKKSKRNQRKKKISPEVPPEPAKSNEPEAISMEIIQPELHPDPKVSEPVGEGIIGEPMEDAVSEPEVIKVLTPEQILLKSKFKSNGSGSSRETDSVLNAATNQLVPGNIEVDKAADPEPEVGKIGGKTGLDFSDSESRGKGSSENILAPKIVGPENESGQSAQPEVEVFDKNIQTENTLAAGVDVAKSVEGVRLAEWASKRGTISLLEIMQTFFGLADKSEKAPEVSKELDRNFKEKELVKQWAAKRGQISFPDMIRLLDVMRKV